MPGAEPFSYPGTRDVGVLLIHGFTGTAYEMRPIGEGLAQRGISSVGVLLRGHGTHPEDMVGCRYQDWLGDAQAGLEELLREHHRVVICGLSMGGTIALNVASRRADDDQIAGIISLCAPLRLVDWRLGLLPILSQLVRWRAWGKPDIKDTTAWDRHVAYRRFRTAAVRQLVALLSDTRQRLGQVRQPLLVVQARTDNIVPPRNAELIFNGVSSAAKRLVWLDNCYHVVTVDYSAPIVQAEVARFVEELDQGGAMLVAAEIHQTAPG